ncbi:MAG: hypothetical protein ACT4QB_06110 [Gammaproteobacteria bacterium]
MKAQHFVKKTAALTLALGALAQPAWAVTNIDSCRTITGRGSFQLTKNLNAAGNCIVIAASDVSLDLRGHTIKGNGTGTGIGFNTDAERARVSVRNGVVTNFRAGIDFTEGFGEVIEGMRVGGDNTMQQGILAGDEAIVRDNVVLAGTRAVGAGDGIQTRTKGIVSGNLVDGAPLRVTCPALVTGNSVSSGNIVDIIFDGENCALSNNQGVEGIARGP